MTTNWESISPPRGSYVGWGTDLGQNVTGKVVSVGTGKDVNGLEVPEIAVELTADTWSFAKGQRTEIEAGSTAIITCGLSNLKKNIIAAALQPGDMVSITLESLYPTAKSPAKIFEVKRARGAAPPVAPVADPWGAQQGSGFSPGGVSNGPAVPQAQPSFGGDLSARAPF